MFGVNERDLIKSLRIKSKVQTHVYTITLFRGLLELDLHSIEFSLILRDTNIGEYEKTKKCVIVGCPWRF